MYYPFCCLPRYLLFCNTVIRGRCVLSTAYLRFRFIIMNSTSFATLPTKKEDSNVVDGGSVSLVVSCRPDVSSTLMTNYFSTRPEVIISTQWQQPGNVANNIRFTRDRRPARLLGYTQFQRPKSELGHLLMHIITVRVSMDVPRSFARMTYQGM